MNRSESERYASEIAFFDREAEEELQALSPIDPAIFERYRTSSRRRFSKEYRLRLVGPLHGKRVLEIGCGAGEQAALLASRGAYVTGIDISPKSIELARARAKLAGVEGRCTFVCAPLAKVDLPESAFDIVWGDGILHHLVHELDAVMQRVVVWAKPGARIVFAEPVSLSPALRKLRLLLPIPPNGTPDERPLEPADLAIVRKYVPTARARPFLFLGRMSKFLFARASYEHASVARRALFDALCAVDYGVLTVPLLRKLAGQFVVYGTVDEPASLAV